MNGCPNHYCEDDGYVTCEGGLTKGRFRVPCQHPEHPHSEDIDVLREQIAEGLRNPRTMPDGNERPDA